MFLYVRPGDSSPLWPRWEIWSEGYAATGERGLAMIHGMIRAETFQKACDEFFKNDRTYRPQDLTVWGCRLFDNEKAARRSFG